MELRACHRHSTSSSQHLAVTSLRSSTRRRVTRRLNNLMVTDAKRDDFFLRFGHLVAHLSSRISGCVCRFLHDHQTYRQTHKNVYIRLRVCVYMYNTYMVNANNVFRYINKLGRVHERPSHYRVEINVMKSASRPGESRPFFILLHRGALLASYICDGSLLF